MRYIPLKPQRLYCQNCEETYNLPQNGTIKLYKELRCPLDNYELVLFSLGNSAGALGKSYPLCPYCYNHPPQFDIEDVVGKETKAQDKTVGEGPLEDSSATTQRPKSGMGCDSCHHPTCAHSSVRNGICPCPGSSESGGECSGTLVLDVNSKPNWKLACNVCNTLLRFHADIHDVKALKQKVCSQCGATLCGFDFNKLKSPLAGGETYYEGCIVCDDLLTELTETMSGRRINLRVLRHERFKRGARGRGRGGRGRRGRGGGGSGKDVKMSFSDF